VTVRDNETAFVDDNTSTLAEQALVRGRRPTDITTMSVSTPSPPSMAIVVEPFFGV